MGWRQSASNVAGCLILIIVILIGLFFLWAMSQGFR